MEINIYLFIDKERARQKSPRLFSYLDDNNITIKIIAWNGTLSGLHKKKDRNTGKVMVCFSSMLTDCTEAELKKECYEHGYFLFYSDTVCKDFRKDKNKIFNENDFLFDGDGFLEEVKKFLI